MASTARRDVPWACPRHYEEYSIDTIGAEIADRCDTIVHAFVAAEKAVCLDRAKPEKYNVK